MQAWCEQSFCVCVFLKDRMKAVREQQLQKHTNTCPASFCLRKNFGHKSLHRKRWQQIYLNKTLCLC